MTSESRQFLRYLADQPKGRVGYGNDEWWDRAQDLADECLAARYVKHRPLYPFPCGFQITPEGRAFLAGEALDA
jgi:hypothetical protein